MDKQFLNGYFDLSRYSVQKIMWHGERYVLCFHGDNENFYVFNDTLRLAAGSSLCTNSAWSNLALTEKDAWEYLPDVVKQINYV